MARIQVLDKQMAELIAAGEVIERPSSVIKELVENSIDAGATIVTVEIKNGGVRLMRITDNGCGIVGEDIPKAFLRHATSKVTNQDDLYRIATLGFRGEALASVCAVSRVELISRTPQNPLGCRYRMEGGEATGEPVEAGCPVGTSIYVRDLFYNIPARMKFLKKDITEGNAIATLLDRLALSHPEVSVRFLREGQQKLQTPGDGNLLSTAYAVYGKEFGASLIPVNGGSGSVRVTGFVTRPENAKGSRSMQHFFINNRYVRSVTVMAALEEAYRNRLMVGKFPGCVLHLEIPCGLVDVNVHPAKLEVKLSDEKLVFDAVYGACQGALSAMGQGVSMLDTAPQTVKNKLNYFDLTNRPLAGEQQQMTAQQYRTVVAPLTVSMRDNSAEKLYMAQLQKSLVQKSHTSSEPIAEIPNPTTAFHKQPEPPPVAVPSPAPVPTPPQAPPAPIPPTVPEPEPMTLVGQVFATYLIAQQGDKMLLVDKHAAHERMLFNRLKAEYGQGSVSRQLLLGSVRYSFVKEVYNALITNLDALEQLGFLAEDFGSGSLLVREIPALLELSALEDTLLELGEKLLRGEPRPEFDKTDHLLHSIACKAAIKGNSFTGQDEQRNLLELLQNDSELRSCPHGRPIIIEFTRRELEKMFGRIV